MAECEVLVRHWQPGRGGPCKFPNFPSPRELRDLAGFGGVTRFKFLIVFGKYHHECAVRGLLLLGKNYDNLKCYSQNAVHCPLKHFLSEI